MTWRPLGTDAGVATSMQVDPDGSFRVRTSQDAEPIIEHNKARQTDGSNGYSKTREMRHVASIPVNVIYQWLQADGILPSTWMRMKRGEHLSYYRKKLNDPDWAYLRVDK